MMNENNNNVNTSIGCGVTECKFNCKGDYCTLSKIHVGNTAPAKKRSAPAATASSANKRFRIF